MGKSDSEAALQLQGRIAKASSNSLVNVIEMTATFKYIFAAAQLLGSQDCYEKSRVTILWLAGVLSCKNEQAQAKWIIVCPEENTCLDA